ncbi:hypothetical protein P4H70_06660 [Paenibacillus ehimensis]|uniref:hypothetical protein n=1 Tax=Paenibacillus ehimensis TaxID=79264 RepID=UPI002C358743|nr:hypothetical protein [Paenibacillus ehimensis]MEC0208629.1 hypothetical protein [Paenibacillus ehimensis]HWO95585.1 hypothetical protein [Bacillus sp. (in: firmicutes)]
MLELLAEINLLEEIDGGMKRDGYPGMIPSFRVNNELIICEILAADDRQVFHRGKTYLITIRLPCGDIFSDIIVPNYAFELNYGSRTVGKGTVMNITQPKEKPK